MPVDLASVRRNLRAVTGLREGSLSLLDDEDLLRRIEIMSGIKRFTERFCGDADFREALALAPEQALARWQLAIDVQDACLIRDASHAADDGVFRGDLTQNLERFREFVMQTQGGLELIERAASSGNPRFRAWRNRQLARLRFQFPPGSEYLVRPAVALELSKGCSVGCWFCAISAERFGGNYVYGDRTRGEWRGVLEALDDALGSAAGSGFCYWATDPLDNPDYEKFASDFHDILGVFPPITTALALKNPDRMRSLLRLSSAKGCRLNRLSILSLKMLDHVHRGFTAVDLTFTEMVLQMPDARIFSNFPVTQPAAKVKAGRTLVSKPDKRNGERDESLSGTIACIVGFLINMVTRTIQLVSPCIATERWPLGYMIFDEAHFETAEELSHVLNQMIESHMPLSVPAKAPIRFRSDIVYAPLDDGFRVSTRWHSLDFRDASDAPAFPGYRKLAESIHAGRYSTEEIVEQFASGVKTREHIQESLDRLFLCGVFSEDPVPQHDRIPVLAN
ncbi:MAG: radical SAM family RiPP maturation amino acid epimerase [Bryobacteraceae bacterium]